MPMSLSLAWTTTTTTICVCAGIGKPPKTPAPKRPCFSPYSEDHCDRQNCRFVCMSHGYSDGGWCDEREVRKLCCCYH